MFNQLRQIVERNKLTTSVDELEKLYIKTLSDIKESLQEKAMELIINEEYKKVNECTKELEEIDGIWKEYSEELTKEAEEEIEEEVEEEISEEEISEEEISEEEISEEEISEEEIFTEKKLIETSEEEADDNETTENIIYEDYSSETDNDSETDEETVEENVELPKTFEIELKDENGNIRATAKYLSNGKILLLSGSKISLKIESYMNDDLVKLKQDLIDGGKVADVGEYYRLLEDETYDDIKDTDVIIFGNLKSSKEYEWVTKFNGKELDKYLKELKNRYQ